MRSSRPKRPRNERYRASPFPVCGRLCRAHETELDQPAEHQARVLLHRVLHGVEGEVRVYRRLVRIVDAGHLLQLAPPRLRIDPFRVALLADAERGVDPHLDEALRPHHVPDFVPGRAIGAHRGAEHDTSVSHDLGGPEAYPPDVHVAVLLAEAEALREV